MNQDNVTKYLKFLSEEIPVQVIKAELAEHKQLLLQAPTGCGKTYTFINLAKEREGKTVFLVPNVSNVIQIAEEYKIPGLYGDEVKEGIWQNSNVVVATYDKANVFLKKHLDQMLVVLDEAHNLQAQASFRSDAIEAVKKLVEKSKEAVFLSATINHLDHSLYGKVLRFEPEEPKKIIGISKMYTSGKNQNKDVATDLIRKLVAEGKRCLVKMNHKSSLYNFQKSLEGSKITSEVLTADNKDKSLVMNKILTEKTLPTNFQVIFCTSILDAGVNLEEVDVIIDIENGDPNAIKQLSARPRVSLKEHYMIIKGDTKNRDPESRYTREKVEKAIEKRVETANSIKDDLEKIFLDAKDETKEYLRIKFSLVEDSLEEEFFVKINGDCKFYVDIEAVRNAEYQKYYNSLQTNPELLKNELLNYGLSTVVEEYDLKSGGGKSSDADMETAQEDKSNELSMQLKTLQALSTQEFALECYLAKDSENLFSSNRHWKGVTVPFDIFKTFGMYMALGFQYRLAYEIMMKSYNSVQKRNRIKSYIFANVYSKLKDSPDILKDKSYKIFEIIYKLYENGATTEDEERARIQCGKILGKNYTSNKLSIRGNEIFVLKNKSTKENGKTIHYKTSNGLHTARSILENFNITEQKYIDEFQELLDNKVEKKMVDVYVNKVFAPNAPENYVEEGACMIESIVEGKNQMYFLKDLNLWMKKKGDEIGKPIPSPYFQEVVITNEIPEDAVGDEILEDAVGDEILEDAVGDEILEDAVGDEILEDVVGDEILEEMKLSEANNLEVA